MGHRLESGASRPPGAATRSTSHCSRSSVQRQHFGARALRSTKLSTGCVVIAGSERRECPDRIANRLRTPRHRGRGAGLARSIGGPSFFRPSLHPPGGSVITFLAPTPSQKKVPAPARANVGRRPRRRRRSRDRRSPVSAGGTRPAASPAWSGGFPDPAPIVPRSMNQVPCSPWKFADNPLITERDPRFSLSNAAEMRRNSL